MRLEPPMRLSACGGVVFAVMNSNFIIMFWNSIFVMNLMSAMFKQRKIVLNGRNISI